MMKRKATTVLGLSRIALGLLALGGCAQDEPESTTQIMVTVDGDADVLAQLTRVEARIYRTEALYEPKPVVTQTFKLPARMPLSFGIVRNDAPRFVLVLEGYGAEDGLPPLIERKVRAEFTDEHTMQLDMRLVSECLRVPNSCDGLNLTCHSDISACGPVEQAALRETKKDVLLPPEAAVRPEVSAACRDVTCPVGYPCTPTLGGGHVCLGQFADWPMPDATPGAKHPPKYDLSVEGIVRDEVTGLSWQREPPATYPNCSQPHLITGPPGSGCSQDEAKRYCHDLTLGGLSWRLPSKIELTSVGEQQTSPTGWATPFLGCPYFTWTSSLHQAYKPGNVREARYALVGGAVTGHRAVTNPLCVRCVSGVTTTPGAGSARYVLEPDQSIRDVFTGLRWQRTFSDPLATAAEASAYCAALGSSFRLPTLKELLTLTDPSRSFPAIDPLFTGTPAGQFWADPTSTAMSDANVVQFAFGDQDEAEQPAGLPTLEQAHPRTRCVR